MTDATGPHPFRMPADVTARVVAKRGRSHCFDDLDPRTTALLVVDLQNGFMVREVAHAYVPAARGIVPNVNRLAAGLRAAGGTVAWIINTFTEESLRSWSHLHTDMMRPELTERRIAAMSEGSVGHRLHADLATDPGDLFVRKTRFSAFIQGSSDLEARLRERGIRTVLVAGCATEVCCESTARDAMMLDFRTVMVADANATTDDRAHAEALTCFYLHFGDVMDTAAVLDLIARRR